MTVRMTLEAFFMYHTKQSCDGYQQPLIKVAARLSWRGLLTLLKTRIKYSKFVGKKLQKWNGNSITMQTTIRNKLRYMRNLLTILLL